MALPLLFFPFLLSFCSLFCAAHLIDINEHLIMPPTEAECGDHLQLHGKTYLICGAVLLFLSLSVLFPALISYFLDDYQIDLGTCNFHDSQFK